MLDTLPGLELPGRGEAADVGVVVIGQLGAGFVDEAGQGSADQEVARLAEGTVVKVLVAVGDTVEAGEPVVVLEAMKMENNLLAGCAGTVSEVRVAAGDLVGGGDLVVLIEPG